MIRDSRTGKPVLLSIYRAVQMQPLVYPERWNKVARSRLRSGIKAFETHLAVEQDQRLGPTVEIDCDTVLRY